LPRIELTCDSTVFSVSHSCLWIERGAALAETAGHLEELVDLERTSVSGLASMHDRET
jgi:hypothetical protein